MNASFFAALNAYSETWAVNMLRACVQGGLFIVGVWLLCRLLPRLPAALRAWLWWLACLKMLVSFMPLSPLNLPLLPAAPPAAVPAVSLNAEAVEPLPPAIARSRVRREDAMPAAVFASGASSASRNRIAASPLTLLLILWTLGLCVSVGNIARRTAKTYRLMRRAEPIREETIRAVAEEVGRTLPLRRPLLLLTSDTVAGPMVAGLPRPAIVLPRRSLASLSASELRMILTHEGTHLRRGDLWLLLLPMLTQTLFCFYPLAWLAAREYHLACEAACDLETLHVTGTDARDYGLMLLKIASSNRRAGTPALGASSGYRILERRLKMLQRITPMSSRRHWSFLVFTLGVSAACMVPWHLSAQSAVVPVAPPTKQVIRKPDTAQTVFVPVNAEAKPASFGKAAPPTPDSQEIGNLIAKAETWTPKRVTPLSHPQPPVHAHTEAADGNSSTSNGSGNEGTATIRLDLGETTIFAALKALFHTAGVSYRIDGDAARLAKGGQVTISIVNVPFRTALEMILNSSRALPTSLTYRFENGFYIIVPAASPNVQPTTITINGNSVAVRVHGNAGVFGQANVQQYHIYRLPDFPFPPNTKTSNSTVTPAKAIALEANIEDVLKSRISIKTENADLRTTLQKLFEQARVNYTLDPSILGEKATVSLSDVPFSTALQALLRQSKRPLTYRIESGIVQVIAKEEPH